MIMSTSLLDYIKKEDSLMKEQDRNFERKADLLHRIDDSVMYPQMYDVSVDELKKYKKEVAELEKREDEIQKELKQVRASIRRYIVKLFDI